MYYDEIIKLQNRERANNIEDISLGFGGKQITNFVKRLRGE